MAHLRSNYLRTYRKRACLTQDEVAFLMGSRNGTKASRYERSIRQPNLENVLAYALIFGIPPKKLFAPAFAQVERETANRARKLLQQMESQHGEAVCERKLAVLRRISETGRAKAEETEPTET